VDEYRLGRESMAGKKGKDEIRKLSFEESIKRLKETVDKIEQGDIGLQDSLEQYEQGMALIQHCRGILEKAEKRIERISQGAEEKGDPADEETTGDDSEVLF
jgi:exodeoxyribonuclease VII small subunit